ncbi:MAG: exonuclease domain-containing protein [Anaerolineae bacterium]|nr:exonuclease domain-containing protein [Anaerolineae bacterium]
MPVRRDQVIVIDVEATCWEGSQIPPGQYSEIIEIGVCLMAVKTCELSAKRSIIVRPKFSRVSPFCTSLTGLTQEQVSAGITFADACLILAEEYDSPHRMWASWGTFERRMFRDQCRRERLHLPFSERHINIKKLFADLNGERVVGMSTALQMAGLPPEGTHHRGRDDAWNGGRVLAALVEQHGREVLIDAFLRSGGEQP